MDDQLTVKVSWSLDLLDHSMSRSDFIFVFMKQGNSTLDCEIVLYSLMLIQADAQTTINKPIVVDDC